MKCKIMACLDVDWISINASTICSQNYHTCLLISLSTPLLLITNLSPTSLSLSNSSDEGVDYQDNVPTFDHPTQPRDPPLLDGIRPHSNSQPDSTRHIAYADALKFGLGGNGNSQVPPSELKPYTKLPRNNSTRLLPIGQTSHQITQTKSDPLMPHLPPHPPLIHMEELLTCCLLGKIWGEPLTSPAIIHKTKKDWYFVKGHLTILMLGTTGLCLGLKNLSIECLSMIRGPDMWAS